MSSANKPVSVSYEYCGFGSVIEMNWSIAGLTGPDHMVITVKRLQKQEHVMMLSSNYATIDEALAAAQGLVRHYVSVVGVQVR